MGNGYYGDFNSFAEEEAAYKAQLEAEAEEQMAAEAQAAEAEVEAVCEQPPEAEQSIYQVMEENN